MKKVVKNVLIVVYAILAIALTVCLLSFNDYRVSEIGGYALLIIDNGELSPNFEKGDLVLVDEDKKIDLGDEVFFYNTYEKEISISKAKITNVEEITKTEKTYTLEGDKDISSEYIIGNAKDVTKISKLGAILNVLESKWGFLFLIVLPALLAFLYELLEFIEEIKSVSKNKEE